MKKIPVRKIALPPHETVANGRFRMRTLTDVLNGADLKQELHRHDFFFILAVQQGKGTHAIDFTKHEISRHSVFVLRPGQVHELELKAHAKGFLGGFDPGFYHPPLKSAQQRLHRAGIRNMCVFQPARFNKINALLETMVDEAVAREDGYSEAIRACLDMFFIEFNRQANSKVRLKPEGAYAQERFEELMQLISGSIASHKQVADYARLLNLSAYQLNAITKRVVGKSVSEIINEQIILEAKRYLLATTSQVKDIADHLGYEDISYFIRFFRKHTGYPPETFRKNFQ